MEALYMGFEQFGIVSINYIKREDVPVLGMRRSLVWNA